MSRKKIISAACQIAQGNQEHLYLGDISVQRDWGWAPEYVEAMYLILQQKQPDDYVIATGESHKLEDFVATAFADVGLDWRRHVVNDASLLRPTDIAAGRGNPSKAREKLGWQAQSKMKDVVQMMIAAKLEVTA